MPPTVSLVHVSPRPLAVVRVTTVLARWPREFMHSLNKVYAAVKAGKVRQTGHNVMIYRPRNDGSVDIECGIDTDGPFADAGEVVFSTTPSGMAIATEHVGRYDQLSRSYEAMNAWGRQNGHRMTGIRKFTAIGTKIRRNCAQIFSI